MIDPIHFRGRNSLDNLCVIIVVFRRLNGLISRGAGCELLRLFNILSLMFVKLTVSPLVLKCFAIRPINSAVIASLLIGI